MRHPLSSSSRLALSAAAMLPLLLATTPAQTRCQVGHVDPDCRSRSIFTQYTGSPTIPCLIGDIVVKIESTANCEGQQAGPAVFYRCGQSSTPFSYSGGGYTHTFGTLSDWGTIFNGQCHHLVYTPT